MKYICSVAELRAWAIAQMMPRLNRAVIELAKATGITQVTLRAWQKAARQEGKIVPGEGKRSNQWSSTDKFRMLLETALLSHYVDAWLRFARMPMIGAVTATDTRFASSPPGNFTSLRFEDLRDHSCPKHVPAWEYPRRDLLKPGDLQRD